MTGSSPPDFTTPEGRAAYKRELAGVAPRLRALGLALSLLGLGLALWGRFAATPAWAAPVALVAIVGGFIFMLFALVRRMRHHMRRMAPRADQQG